MWSICVSNAWFSNHWVDLNRSFKADKPLNIQNTAKFSNLLPSFRYKSTKSFIKSALKAKKSIENLLLDLLLTFCLYKATINNCKWNNFNPETSIHTWNYSVLIDKMVFIIMYVKYKNSIICLFRKKRKIKHNNLSIFMRWMKSSGKHLLNKAVKINNLFISEFSITRHHFLSVL